MRSLRERCLVLDAAAVWLPRQARCEVGRAVEVICAVNRRRAVRIDRYPKHTIPACGGLEHSVDLGQGLLRIVQEGADAGDDAIGEPRVLLKVQPASKPSLLEVAPVAVVVHGYAKIEEIGRAH